jgi:hypothetical protein
MHDHFLVPSHKNLKGIGVSLGNDLQMTWLNDPEIGWARPNNIPDLMEEVLGLDHLLI